MTVLSLNIDNINRINDGSVFNSIEKYCKDTYLSSEIHLFFINIRLKRLVRRLSKYNKLIIRDLYKADFNQIKELETISKQLLQTLDNEAKSCINCTRSEYCKKIFRHTLYDPLTTSFNQMLKAIDGSYYFHANDIFKNEEEYKQHCAALKTFADLWDDEITDEDKELAFNFNKELTLVK
jgi:hypothetical protein